MAEIASKQATRALGASGAKLLQTDFSKVRILTITSPDTVTWADGDIIASPVILPAGTRFTCGTFVSHADMGTSITLNIGIRTVAGVAIDADGIAASLDVSTASARTIGNNGALVAAGVEYVTTVPCQVYATLAGGTPTANAQIRIEVECLTGG